VVDVARILLASTDPREDERRKMKKTARDPKVEGREGGACIH
jgi:hypothetical protein